MAIPNPADLSLRGPGLKVGRAKAKIHELAAEVNAFIESNPYEVIREADPAVGQDVFLARLTRQLPDAVDGLVSEILYNLHSALDQLTCALAQLNNRGVSGVYFPFAKDAQDFVSSTVQEKIKNLSPEGQAFVSQFKPYFGGNDELKLIHSLHLTDKHRRLIAIGHAVDGLSIRGAVFWGGGLILGNPKPWQRLDEGVEIYRVHSGTQVYGGQHAVTVNIAFAEPNEAAGKPIIHALDRMTNHVWTIVAWCEKTFFPGKPSGLPV